MNPKEIIELVVISVVVLALVIYYSIKAVKNGWIKKLTNTIEMAIKDAERKYPDQGSGKQKLEYVMNCVEDKCVELGIPYSLLKSLIEKIINTIIAHYNVISK